MSLTINNLYLLLFIFYFFLSSAFDLKNKSVPILVHIIFILAGIPLFLYFNVFTHKAFGINIIQNLALRFIPGMFLSTLSVLSRGALGIGDGIFVTVSGLFIPINYILSIVISGFLSAFFASVGILIYGKLRNRDLHRMSLPFIPFMLPGLYLILFNL